MIQAIELCGGTPIVRVPWNEPGIIGKVLDAGAHGVVVPMVNTREQAEAVVRSTLRAWRLTQLGPVMAGMRHDDNRAWAEAHVATIPMIETAEAIENLDEILSVPGVDAIYVGPADLSISLGLGPYGNDGNAVFDDAVDDRRRLPTSRRGAGHPRQRPAHACSSRAGLPDDHRPSDQLAIRLGYTSELAAARGSACEATGSKFTDRSQVGGLARFGRDRLGPCGSRCARIRCSSRARTASPWSAPISSTSHPPCAK